MGQAYRLLAEALSHIGRESPPFRWVEETETWLEEHQYYRPGNRPDPGTFAESGDLGD